MMKKTVYHTSSKPDLDKDNNPCGCILKAIRYAVPGMEFIRGLK
jgi:hypothetical protein